MRRGKMPAVVLAIGIGVALALGVNVALTAPSASIPWSVFGAGGTTASSSTSYRMGSTAGQSAIGPAGSAGFQLGAGFWYGACSDTDIDCVSDATDDCPRWPNPHQTLPPWPIPAGDADCDGFPDTVNASGKTRETYIGTDPTKHCAATAALNDEGGVDAMPPDFNDDRIINGQDTGKFGGPFGSYNHPIGDGPFNGIPGVRFDFSGNGIINGQDTGKFQSYFNKVCTVSGP